MVDRQFDYSGLTLAVLKPLAGRRGMPNVARARRGDIVAWLISQDSAALPAQQVPTIDAPMASEISHIPAQGSSKDGETYNAASRPLGVPCDPSQQQFAARLDSITTAVNTLLASVGQFATKYEGNGRHQGLTSNALAALLPPPVAMMPAPIDEIYQFAPHVSADLIEAIYSNDLAVWDLWRLDNTRAKELGKAPPRTTGWDVDRERAMTAASPQRGGRPTSSSTSGTTYSALATRRWRILRQSPDLQRVQRS